MCTLSEIAGVLVERNAKKTIIGSMQRKRLLFELNQLVAGFNLK